MNDYVLVILRNPILELQHTPLPPKCYEPRSVPWLLALPLFSLQTHICVATLTLGSRPRQGVARLRGKKKIRESHHMLPGVQKVWRNEPSHSQVDSHVGSWTPKWTPKFFRAWLQGSKPIAFKSSLYHWKAIKIHMSKMGSHCPFGHLKHKLWAKEKSWIKLTIWLPTTKSRESTLFPSVQAMCNISLESSWQGLQLFFGPHCNRRFAHQVMRPQNYKSPNYGNFGTHTWESRDKNPFECGPRGEVQNIL
jgi:hypothetical protein